MNEGGCDVIGVLFDFVKEYFIGIVSGVVNEVVVID